MKKAILATGLIIMTSFAYASEKFNYIYNQNTPIEDLISKNPEFPIDKTINYGECTVKLTASIGFGENKISIECSATNENCTTAFADAWQCYKIAKHNLQELQKSFFDLW